MLPSPLAGEGPGVIGAGGEGLGLGARGQGALHAESLAGAIPIGPAWACESIGRSCLKFIAMRISWTLEKGLIGGAMPTALREGVRELVCRAGGLIPPVQPHSEPLKRTHFNSAGKTPGINPGARGALFRLIPSAEFPDTFTALRGRCESVGHSRAMPTQSHHVGCVCT